MAASAETVPETVAAPEKETEKTEEVSKSEEKEVQKEEQKEAAEEKNGHSETDEGKKNGHSLENGTEAPEKKANGTPEENEAEEVSDACPVKRKSEAADIPDSKVSEEDAVSCEKKAKIEEKLAAAKGEEVLNSEEAEATA